MRNFIIAAMLLISAQLSAQNYFSTISVTNEFGKTTTVQKNGRINITENKVIVKTESGIYKQLEIFKEYSEGTKDDPIEINGNFVYEEGYECCLNANSPEIYVVAKRTLVTQYTHSYLEHRWIIWKYDTDGEVVETTVFK